MIFLKLNGFVLTKEKVKDNDALIYILTKNYGIIKCFAKGLFQSKSKNLSILQSGNYNRFFLLGNGEKFKIISALPLKIVNKTFYQQPYRFLWSLRLVKNLNLLETPPFLWFIIKNLEIYLKQSPRNFSAWFLFQILKELGYEINLDNCHHCGRKLKKFAFFDNKSFFYCGYCSQKYYSKINQQNLEKAKKIKNRLTIPKKIPDFLKLAINNYFKKIY